MKLKADIRECDVCGKKVSDNGYPNFGGSVFSGWYSVRVVGGGTSIDELQSQHSWDVCSSNCLRVFADKRLITSPTSTCG